MKTVSGHGREGREMIGAMKNIGCDDGVGEGIDCDGPQLGRAGDGRWKEKSVEEREEVHGRMSN